MLDFSLAPRVGDEIPHKVLSIQQVIGFEN